MARPTTITGIYDQDATALYRSPGEPRSAVGIDDGDGLLLRNDEARNGVTGCPSSAPASG